MQASHGHRSTNYILLLLDGYLQNSFQEYVEAYSPGRSIYQLQREIA